MMMLKQDIDFIEFRKAISELLGIDESEINEESVIYQDIGIDSLGLVNLGIKIQKIYEIEIPPAVMVEVRTIGDFYYNVKELVQNK